MKSSAATTGWRCPQCGRRFVRRTREHSCDVRSLEAHLVKASAVVKDTLHELRAVLDGLGPHGIVPVKTMILLRAAANFGSIVIRSNWLELGFISDRVIHHVRIHKSERLGPSKHAYRVRLHSPADVDAQIASWLDEAYRLGE